MAKEKNQKSKQSNKEAELPQLEQISLVTDILTTDDLKKFLIMVRDRMSDGAGPPVFAMSALSHVLTLQNVYQIMSEENREISRDIWLRLKQSGFHIKSPPILFDAAEKFNEITAR